MIPYEELCDALARWRSRNGLANGPSARMPTGPLNPITLVAPPPTDIAATPPQGEPALSTAHDTAPGPAPAANPYPLAQPPMLAGEDSLDLPTGLHLVETPRESTNEINLDSDLIDEDDV